jgi:hypothetical protein
MRSKARFAGRGALFIVAIAALGAVVMLLWNAVIPALFAAAQPIGYLQALGLLVLSRILFGNFRGHGGWHRHKHWDKWHAMTPEEREQFVRSGPWGRHRGKEA